MGKQRYLLWALCGFATLASCDRGDEMMMPADDAIRFDNRIGESYVEDLTRGVATDNDNLAEFGVFAYIGAYNAQTSKPEYMYNVYVTRPQGIWKYTPLKFWPQGSVSFFAYTPYADTNTDVSVACTAGAPRVTYAVPDNVKAHRDLMLSAPSINQTKNEGAVMLTFHHALACIDFKARVNGTLTAGQSIKVTTISLGYFKDKASCHHELETITSLISEDTSDKAYTLSVANNTLKEETLTNAEQQITSADGCPMLWPQSIDAEDKLTIIAEYTSNGMTRTVVFEREIQNFVSNIEAGKRYTFNLLFTSFGSMALTRQVVAWEKETINVPDFD